MAPLMNSVQLKISLRGSSPEIWRSIVVPRDVTLGDLHNAIQHVMGWEDCHLHGFRAGSQQYGPPDDEFGGSVMNENATTLRQVLPKKGSRLVYQYDFGDSWDHDVVVEKLVASENDGIELIAGARACPPEDIGGVHRYNELVRLLAKENKRKPSDDEGLQMLMEMEFDPAELDLDAVRQGLKHSDAEREAFGDECPESEGQTGCTAFDADGEPLLYDPNDSRGPDPVRWQAAAEISQIAAIVDFHRFAEEDTGESAEAHAGFHLSVETQLLTSNPPDVADVLEKLVASGSTRHEGIHAIGRLLARQLFSLTKGEQEEFDMPRYQRELRELLPKSSASSKVLPFRGDAPRTAAPRPWRPSSRKRRR